MGRVIDRRRFDADGTPRDEADPVQAEAPETSGQPREHVEPPLPECTEEPRPQPASAEAEPERDESAAAEAPKKPQVDPELVRAQLELVGARRRIDELARAYQ